MSRDQCQATLHGSGLHCQHAAKHWHRDEAGDRWHLCNVHLKNMLRREALGSAPALAARWRAER